MIFLRSLRVGVPPWALAKPTLKQKERPYPEVQLDDSTLYQIAACEIRFIILRYSDNR